MNRPPTDDSAPSRVDLLSELAGLIKVLAAEVLIMDLIKQECNMI